MSRADIQKPIVRMWLFGVITLIEIDIVDLIQSQFSEKDWQKLVSPQRLEKAIQLLTERQRRNQSCDLLNYLQLSDKAHILSQNDQNNQF